VRSVALVVLGSIVGACAPHRAIVADGTRTSMRDTVRSQSVDSMYAPDGITPNPLEANAERDQSAVALAERLSRLDALIRNAPLDSARALRREYEQVLAEYTGEDRFADTGPPRVDNPAMRALQNETTRGAIDSFLSAREGHRPTATARVEPAAKTATSPRSPERATRSSRVDAVGAPRGAGRNVDAKRLRAGAERRQATRSRRVVSTQRSRVRTDGNRMFIDGLASSRSGRHELASEQLPAAIESGDLTPEHRSIAEVALGESLLELGKSGRAADVFANAMRRSADARDRGVVGRCRALARAGSRREAKRMLVNFIRNNPNSRSIVAARKLLQTL